MRIEVGSMQSDLVIIKDVLGSKSMVCRENLKHVYMSEKEAFKKPRLSASVVSFASGQLSNAYIFHVSIVGAEPYVTAEAKYRF